MSNQTNPEEFKKDFFRSLFVALFMFALVVTLMFFTGVGGCT